MYENILFEKKDGVAYLTLNRPDRLNALNGAVLKELDDALAAIDGDLTQKEREILLYAEQVFRLHGYVNAFFRVQTENSEQENLETYYKILEVSPEATDQELKSAYRKKCIEFLPDKLQSKGLPPEMLAHAENEMRRINQAYDAICAFRAKQPGK